MFKNVFFRTLAPASDIEKTQVFLIPHVFEKSFRFLSFQWQTYENPAEYFETGRKIFGVKDGLIMIFGLLVRTFRNFSKNFSAGM